MLFVSPNLITYVKSLGDFLYYLTCMYAHMYEQ